MKVKRESEVAQPCLTLATPCTAAYHAPPSMGFSRQEYWSRMPLPPPSTNLITDRVMGMSKFKVQGQVGVCSANKDRDPFPKGSPKALR